MLIEWNNGGAAEKSQSQVEKSDFILKIYQTLILSKKSSHFDFELQNHNLKCERIVEVESQR